MSVEVLHGDCLDVLRTLPDCSVDAVVTDPPYGLSFMGKRWDYDVPSVEVWAECLRVLKPGGHLLAFAGTRTQHRMAVRIEDAGFEIRDMIAWVYGSGFPKSMDVSKAIDKAAGAERTERLAPKAGHENFVGRDNMKALRESGALSGDGGFSRPWMRDPQKVEDAHWDFAPATDAARQWQGWGTALKPALEPITVARKPLIGTVAENVLRHGTGGLNIDGCRVEAGTEYSGLRVTQGGKTRFTQDGANHERASQFLPAAGRWPANLIHDGSEEVLAAFPQAKGQQGALTGSEPSSKTANAYGEFAGRAASDPRGDTGSAARFFYCAKASRADRNDGLQSGAKPAVGTGATMREREDADWPSRNGNHHPTVKPTDLMRYLCRLVTPPGGLVLDPFTGSGSTGKAAVLEGFRFIGIEREAEYVEIARARIAAAQAGAEKAAEPSRQPDLFGSAP